MRGVNEEKRKPNLKKRIRKFREITDDLCGKVFSCTPCSDCFYFVHIFESLKNA